MLECIGETFLHDPIGGELDGARQRVAVAVEVELHGESCALDVVREGLEAVEARLRRELNAVTVAAHRSQQAAHLG